MTRDIGPSDRVWSTIDNMHHAGGLSYVFGTVGVLAFVYGMWRTGSNGYRRSGTNKLSEFGAIVCLVLSVISIPGCVISKIFGW